MNYESGVGRGRGLVEGGDLRRPHTMPAELAQQQLEYLQRARNNQLANHVDPQGQTHNASYSGVVAGNLQNAQIRAAANYLQNQHQLNTTLAQANLSIIRGVQPSMGNIAMHPVTQHVQMQPGNIPIVQPVNVGMNLSGHEQMAKDLSNMTLSSNVSIMNQGNPSGMQTFSKLSADAPEFVPRSCGSSQQIQNSDGSTEKFYPQPSAPQLQYLSNPVILQVNNIVVTLTMKPHKFEQIANQLKSILSWQVKEEGLMKEVIAVIFEQGVGEANFRFNGARLMQFLSKNITQSYNGPSFKTLLLTRCGEDYNFRDLYLQTDPKRLCGFTLFLSDIYTHLVTPQSQPLDKLREGVCNLLITLMSDPTSTNLKCVVQVLKGSGRSLDLPGTLEMDKVMERLKDLTFTSAAAAGNLKDMLLSVIELRAANWGQVPGEENNDSIISQSTPSQILGTVYYGPDGMVQRIEQDETEDSASDTDDFYGVPGPNSEDLEGEVAIAFEEFLRSQQH